MIGKNQKFRISLLIGFLILGLVIGLVGQASPVQAVGGSYSLAFSAADPDIYILEGSGIPFPNEVPMPATGRVNGESLIPKAWYKRPGGVDVKVQSLSPENMAAGQIVPFEVKIFVSGLTTPENGCISFVGGWETGGTGYGYDTNYMVYAAFVDIGDGAHVDPDEEASVTSFSSVVVSDEIQGTINVCGLDDGDVVVVEVWVVLESIVPEKVGGTVQSRLVSAQTAVGDTISTGNQTVPLLRLSEFTTAMVDISVAKDDDDIWKSVGVPYWYDIYVNYPGVAEYTAIANSIIVTDTLDQWLDYLSDARATSATPSETDHGYGVYYWSSGAWVLQELRICTHSDETTGGTVTCDVGALAPGGQTLIRFWVQAVTGVPMDGLVETGTCTGTGPTFPYSPPWTSPSGSVDICNQVSITTISADQNTGNNSASEPKDIGIPTAVELISFEATGQSGSILLTWEVGSETETLGYNLYRAASLKGPRTLLTETPIFVGEAYEYLDVVKSRNTFYYWLESVDLSGETTVYDLVPSARALK